MCMCPDDCNCRKEWRVNYCGCTAHGSDAFLSCTTCGRSTYAPWMHFDVAGQLTEACCDRSHDPYLGSLGQAYAAKFYRFWNPSSVRSRSELIDV